MADSRWLVREALAKGNANAADEIFCCLQPAPAGFDPPRGQIIDAGIVSAPEQRKRWEQNDRP
jgi:hypothetical protein